MSDSERAIERLLDRNSSAIESEHLAARLGRWAQEPGTLAANLSRAIATLVDGGELRPGDRLPAERSLAAAISVSRGTVVAAYALLAEDGVVERRQGSGTRVSGASGRIRGSALRERRGESLFSATGSAIDLLRAVPRMPDLAARIVRAHRPPLDPATLSDTDPAGLPFVRARIAQLFEDEGTPTTPEQILVTHGSQQAISLVVSELVSAGDVVLTEAVTWPGLADSVRRQGGRVHGVTIGEEGIDVLELESSIARLRPVLVALNPHHHNPTGSRMPAAARQRIADLAAEYGVPVLEDRVLAHIAFDGVVPPTLAALRPDAPILVVDSVSKWSWSALRFGWLRTDPVLVRRLRGLRQLVDVSTSVPAQLLAVDLVDNAHSLRREVIETHARAAAVLADALAEHLPDWQVAMPLGGLSAWAELPAGSASTLANMAAMNGVAIAGGVEFAASAAPDDHIRIPFTAPTDQLIEGIRRVGVTWTAYRRLL